MWALKLRPGLRGATELASLSGFSFLTGCIPLTKGGFGNTLRKRLPMPELGGLMRHFLRAN